MTIPSLAPPTFSNPKTFHKYAYNGFEAPHNFPDPQSLEAYRQMQFQKSEIQVQWIARRIPKSPEILELGCGNGRLLVCMAKKGMLHKGLGTDVAPSRIEFAQRWCRKLHLSDLLSFQVQDVLEFPVYGRRFDLAVCITGAFGYFGCVPQRDLKFLQWATQQLKPGGLLILELYHHHQLEKSCLSSPNFKVQFWNSLPPNDPFSFYLHEVRLHPKRKSLEHMKVFIRRDGAVDSPRTEWLRLYSLSEVRILLQRAGFRVLACSDNWKERSPRKHTEVSVWAAQKK